MKGRVKPSGWERLAMNDVGRWFGGGTPSKPILVSGSMETFRGCPRRYLKRIPGRSRPHYGGSGRTLGNQSCGGGSVLIVVRSGISSAHSPSLWPSDKSRRTRPQSGKATGEHPLRLSRSCIEGLRAGHPSHLHKGGNDRSKSRTPGVPPFRDSCRPTFRTAADCGGD